MSEIHMHSDREFMAEKIHSSNTIDNMSVQYEHLSTIITVPARPNNRVTSSIGTSHKKYAVHSKGTPVNIICLVMIDTR